jgi:hypothetical protein
MLAYFKSLAGMNFFSKIFGRAFNLPGHTNFNNIWNLLQMKTLKFQTDVDCSLELQEKIEENNDTENRVLLDLSCNWLGLQSLTSVENSNFSQSFIDCQNFSPAMPRSICRLFSRETQD